VGNEVRFNSLRGLEINTSTCTRCRLSATRKNVVPGEGPEKAELMFVGEGPGSEEDATGRPFVGRAGRLLDQAMKEADIGREDVYITNLVKCRPPDNRQPMEDEMNACHDFLVAQIEFVDPVIVCTLGATALMRVLGKRGISSHRGRIFRQSGRIIVPTFHPAGALRNPLLKPFFLSDVKEVGRLITSREAYGKDRRDQTLFG